MPPAAPVATGFSRGLRLVNGKQFNAVFDHKRRLHGAHFNIHVAPNELGHARIGLAVSRRVSKKAVERNRLKRIIRDSFRRCQHQLGAVDYVVIVKVGAAKPASEPNLGLRSELDNSWAKARRKL